MTKALVRSLVIAMVAGALMLLGGSALATSGTGTQNRDLTVAVSVSNVGGGHDANPDTATAGETVTVNASVRNNTSRSQPVAVRATLTGPGGLEESYAASVWVSAGQTVRISYGVTVESSYPLGTYQLTVAASNRHGTSSATASIQIV
jgi:hypothetical protein